VKHAHHILERSCKTLARVARFCFVRFVASNALKKMKNNLDQFG